jgi:CRISPR-associated RAMP protein (TIGR02581 family)
MHKKLLNEALFSLTILVEGPLLIKSGTEGWDPTTPDMEFVRTRHAQLGETVFFPGSSLKGTLRSYSEKIARTLNVNCCDPFDKEHSCGNRKTMKQLTENHDSAGIYRESCVACKLYGSTSLAGRAAFTDAYPKERIDIAKQLTKRTAVAIDRVLGSVAFGPFDFEALMSGEFHTVIRLRNFELWQLGLLGLAIRDFCQGRVRVGYGKSRGFGSVIGRLEKLEMRSIADRGIEINAGNLIVKGIGASLKADERKTYGILEAEESPVSVTTKASILDDLIGSSVVFERRVDGQELIAPEVIELFSKCVKEPWAAYRKAHPAKGEKNG